MSCGCKSGSKDSKISDYSGEPQNEGEKLTFVQNIIRYFFKALGFLLSLVILPIVLAFTIWLLFDTLVLNKNVDTKKIVKVVAKYIRTFNENNEDYDDKEEQDDDEEFNEDDYTPVNVEDITPPVQEK